MVPKTPQQRVLFARSLRLALLVIAGVFSLLAVNLHSAPKVQAATSSNLNFQARLETAAGAVAPDGNYNVEFKIYSGASCNPATGGSCTTEWTEDWLNNASNGIHTANGYLTANLGSITAFPSTINWDQQLYISMTVRGTGSCTFGTCTPTDSAMLPYMKLTAVPYAFSAGQLQTTSGANTSKLSIQAPTGGAQTFQIQDQGASGTFSLLTQNSSGVTALGTVSSLSGSIKFFNSGSANSITLATAAETVGSATITIPNTAGVADTICLSTLANCGGGSGATSVGTIDTGTYSANGGNIAAGVLYLQAASGIHVGLVTIGAQTFAGDKTFADNLIVSAGKYVKITGSSTRPGSPTAGMLYYDTSTNQLLQYNGTKWIGDSRTATKIVAASTSSQAEKDAADYVATGTSDQNTINSAITALPSGGGTVYLMEGTFTVDDTVTVPSNVQILGAGASTILKVKNGTNASDYIFVNSDTTNGNENIHIANMTLDGNSANNSPTFGGIEFTGTLVQNVTIENVIFQNLSVGIANVAFNSLYQGNKFYHNIIGMDLETGGYSRILGNYFEGNTSNDIHIFTDNHDVISNNVSYQSTYGYLLEDTSYTVFTNNTSTDDSSLAIDLEGGGNNSISNNIVTNSSSVAITVSGNGSNVVSNNTVTNSGSTAILVTSTNNSISNNILTNNGGSGSASTIEVASGSNNTIADNVITDTAGSGYAFQVDSGISGTILRGNTYSGSGAADFSDNGTGTIYSNQLDNSGNLINRNTGGGLSIGKIGAAATLDIQGGIKVAPLPSPSAPTLAIVGTGGTIARDYAVSALDGNGETLISTTTSTGATSNATLSSSNYIRISWPQVSGAVQYKIYRTSTTGTNANTAGRIGTVSGNTLTYVDNGLAAGGSAPAANTTGGASLQGGASVGLAGTTFGTIKFYSATGAGSVTLSLSNGTSGFDYTLLLPSISANDTICLQTAANCGGSGATSVGTIDTGTYSANGGNIAAGVLYLQAASGIHVGLVTIGAQTFAGNKTFADNIIVSAGKYITLTGSGTRPGSPTDGMLYYDTTTHQLLQYSTGLTKWVSDRTNAIIVAANNSTQAEKDAADYVATGTGDQSTINTALTDADPAGSGRKVGAVLLLGGTYNLTAAISVPNNTTLAGVGAATIITIPNAQNGTYNMITNTDTSTGTKVTIRDLLVNGNKANQTAGSMHGIYLDHMGSGTGSSAVEGAKVLNVIVKAIKGGASASGIFLNVSSNNVISGNHTLDDSAGISLDTSSYNTVSGNLSEGNSNYGLYTSNGGAGVTYNTITGNTFQGNVNGIYLNGASNNTVTGNTIQSGTRGIYLTTVANYNNISGNTIASNTTGGIYFSSGNNNFVSGNKLHDNGGATTNEGIAFQNATTSTNNSISNNDITDTSCTTNCYAIDIPSSGISGTYLSSNRYSGSAANAASINDAGTGTIYANQQDGSGNLINKSQGGGLTVGASSASSSLTLQGGLISIQLPTPAAPTVTSNAGSGTTTSYKITVLDGIGETLPSAVGTVSGGATPNNTITWVPIGGAYQYKVYRTVGGATQGLLATVAGNLSSYIDNATVASGSVPTANTTGDAVLQGGALTLGLASTNSGTVKFMSSTGTGSVSLNLSNGASAGNYTLSLPSISANDTICLQTAANCGSTISLGTYSTTNTDAHGATLSSGVLTFQDASGSAPGMVGTGTQTFAGDKTFTGNTLLKNNSATSFRIQNTSNQNVLAVDASANHLKVYDGTATQGYVDIYYDDGTSSAIIAASSGTTKIGSGSGPVNITAGSGAAVSVTAHASSSFATDAGDLTLSTNSVGAAIIAKSNTNSAAAFQVQNTSGNQIFGVDTSASQALLGKASTVNGSLKFFSSTGTGSISLNLSNGASSGNYNLTIPSISANDTICLQTAANCGGGSGATSVGTIDTGTYSANGGNIAAGVLYLQSASNIHVGLVTIGAQTFAGDKTFNGAGILAVTGANALAVTGAPTNSATSSLIQIGSAIVSGNNAANGGTYFGLNAPSSGPGSAADLIDFQHAGVGVFSVDSAGVVTTTGGLVSSPGLLAGTALIDAAGNFSTSGTGVFTTASTAAFQVQNALGTPIFLVDTSTTSNLLKNPGFEAGTSDWFGISATIAQNLTKANTYHGIASLSVNVTAGGGNALLSNADFTATVSSAGSANYNFSFYAMAGTNAGTLTVTVNGGGAPACTLASGAMITTAFKRYSCTFAPSAVAVTSISINSSATGTLFIDAVQLVTGTVAIPYSSPGAIQLEGVINNPVLFQSVSNSTTAFQLANAGGTVFLNADTSANVISVGSTTTDTTAILFTVDSYSTAADPTGVAGGMYYNTNVNAFRCYENSVWRNCIDSPSNQSTADQAVGASATAYLTGSAIKIPQGGVKVGSQFMWKIAVTKTGAGLVGTKYSMYLGANGTTGDTSRVAMTAANAETAVADTALVTIICTVRSISATSTWICTSSLSHSLSTTGFNNQSSTVISGTFDDTALSGQFVGIVTITGASESLTFGQVQATSVNL